ncbi:hypothetical protein ACFL2D_02265 [Patescibacteria group bacterium]
MGIEILEYVGFTIDIAGKILIGYTAIMVHHRFYKEHRVDAKVFKTMKKEQTYGIIGLVFIIMGYIMQFPAKWPFF